MIASLSVWEILGIALLVGVGLRVLGPLLYGMGLIVFELFRGGGPRGGGGSEFGGPMDANGEGGG